MVLVVAAGSWHPARSAEFRTRDGRRQAAHNLIDRAIDALVVVGGAEEVVSGVTEDVVGATDDEEVSTTDEEVCAVEEVLAPVPTREF